MPVVTSGPLPHNFIATTNGSWTFPPGPTALLGMLFRMANCNDYLGANSVDADINVIVRLNRDVQQLHADLEPAFFKSNTNHEEVAAFFAGKLALREPFRLADGDNGPNGYVWFEVQERAETALTFPSKRIYIHHLSVRRRARRRGIASELMRQVEAEALAEGITSIALATWARELNKHELFCSLRFRSMFNLTLGKRLT